MFDPSGIGGQVRPQEASEAISEIPQNRTLLVEKLTADAPAKPEIVKGLKTVEEVFEHYQPNVEVDFEAADGTEKNETLSFRNLGDFGKKGIVAQSGFLQDLELQKDNYAQFIKYLRSNKIFQKLLADPEAKAAYLEALQNLIQEIDQAES